MSRNFTATVKEGPTGTPCYVCLELDSGAGLDEMVIRLQPGQDSFDRAQLLANTLNASVLSFTPNRSDGPAFQTQVPLGLRQR